MKTQIINWKDVVSQFGLVSNSGLLTAQQISKQLTNELIKQSKAGNDVENLAFECNQHSEAVVLFELEKIVHNGIMNVWYYEYIGTAN